MTHKLIAATALGLLLATTAAGCSAGTPAPTSAASVDPSRVSPTGLPTAPEVKNAQGAIKDLTMGDCPTAAGDQTVSGKLTSSASATADFLVTVSWTNATGDVMGRGYKVLSDVAPGASESFEIKAKVAAGATQCVKGVEYGTIKG